MTRRGLLALLSPQYAVQGTLRPRRDVFLVPSASYTLSALPWGAAQVFVNGLLMLEGSDYTMLSRTLSFTGQPTAQMQTLIVQAIYWSTT